MVAQRYRKLASPIGVLTLVENLQGSITHILFQGEEPPGGAVSDAHAAERAAAQLTEYFEGRRRQFDLELAPSGTTFQRQVWQQLLKVGYGETRSYGQIAKAIGRPAAVRAVGSANGSNPIPIVIPCHRIIGANGSLIGFGGGLPTKRKLLELEGALAPGFL